LREWGIGGKKTQSVKGKEAIQGGGKVTVYFGILEKKIECRGKTYHATYRKGRDANVGGGRKW